MSREGMKAAKPQRVALSVPDRKAGCTRRRDRKITNRFEHVFKLKFDSQCSPYLSQISKSMRSRSAIPLSCRGIDWATLRKVSRRGTGWRGSEWRCIWKVEFFADCGLPLFCLFLDQHRGGFRD
jgi:hypothetical protein